MLCTGTMRCFFWTRDDATRGVGSQENSAVSRLSLGCLDRPRRKSVRCQSGVQQSKSVVRSGRELPAMTKTRLNLAS